MIDLDKLEEAAKAATGGPWHWAGNTDTGEPYLATWIRGAGRCQVLSIGSEDRSTTGRAADSVRSYARESDLDPEEMVEEWATDSFGAPVQEPRLQFMTDLMGVNARDIAVYEVAPSATSREDPEVYRADVVGIRHPDATFIAAANPAVVLELIERVREAESERDYAEKQSRENAVQLRMALNVRDVAVARIARVEALLPGPRTWAETLSRDYSGRMWPRVVDVEDVRAALVDDSAVAHALTEGESDGS